MMNNRANQNNGFDNAANKVSVDAAAFGAKFQSKGEVYRFLTHDCGTYLPKYDTVTVYHMKELASG